ncbi:DNA-directed RNA polymerase I subuni [Tubulinosema ratisbonensis]|uniref:DNA-directed RNA polymerase I subunit RPA12 n=1 Tax=Tubulinosema ratisbonensis TaxID=291195 RepID=A0A437ALY6_9MICR|nr:DNA-directed RNA polymerase I subuni [Tubulinosema ratisbonensis]
MFCSCGSVLLIPTASEKYTCKTCNKKNKFEKNKLKFIKIYDDPKEKCDEVVDPKIKRICENCGEKEMAFKSVQLRSADEGQTIFYSCNTCGFRITVHS